MKRRGSGDNQRSEKVVSGVESPALVDTAREPEVIEAGQASKSSSADVPPEPLPAALYLVSTPIGNARDITLRALDVLTQADVIACEDTRVSARLLARHAVSRPLLRYDEHTAERAGPDLLRRIAAGARVALISDAGTPLISDPGERLVRACLDAGLKVVPIPGASAVLTALSVSGLPPCPFLFAGFLPPRQAARRRVLAALAGIEATLVLMESPQRLSASLADMAEVLGGREATVARELTKLFEEVRRAPLSDLAAHYAAAGAPRGEVTIVVEPPPPAPVAGEQEAQRLLEDAVRRLPPGDAAAEVAAATGLPRRMLYARAVALKAMRE
jgi:16S rRNA (cytidine1402-2'-O)-methyltransferase